MKNSSDWQLSGGRSRWYSPGRGSLPEPSFSLRGRKRKLECFQIKTSVMRFDLKGFVIELQEFPGAVHSTGRSCFFQTGRGAALVGEGPRGEVFTDPFTVPFPLYILLP